MSNYFADVAWGTNADNVSAYYDTGVFQLNQYTVDVYPLDVNEPGGSTQSVSEGDYFIDYLGYPWQVQSITALSKGKRLLLLDVNSRSISELINYGPYANRIGYVYRPIKGAVILSQAQLLKLDSQARDRINNIEKGVIWENLNDSGSIYDTVLGMQVDATLDPGLTPVVGDNYIILDSATINSNFGTISGLENNDIVEYNGSSFEVSFDSSLSLISITVTVTTDADGNTNELWSFNSIDQEWINKKVDINYWNKIEDNLNYNAGNVAIDEEDPLFEFVVNGDIGYGHTIYDGDFTSFIRPATGKKGGAIKLSSSNVSASDSYIQLGGYDNLDLFTPYLHAQTHDGKIGINQINPSYDLDVNGSVRITGLTNLNGVEYTWPSANGTNDYVLTTNGSGVLSWSQKTGGTTGTITSLNGSSEAAQTIVGGTGLSVVESGTGSYIHTISATSGYLIPTTSQETNWNSAYSHSIINSGNPHSVTHNTTSPSLVSSSEDYGHLNYGSQDVYGKKSFLTSVGIGTNDLSSYSSRVSACAILLNSDTTVLDSFVSVPSTLSLINESSTNGSISRLGFVGVNNTNTRIESASISAVFNNHLYSGISTDLVFSTNNPFVEIGSYERFRIDSFGSLFIKETPSTDASSSPVLVRDSTTGQIKQTTLTAATNNYVNSATFNSSDGKLTLGRLGLSDVVSNSFDGRYLTSYTETDPIFVASASYGISSGDISSWQVAYNRSIDTNPTFNTSNGNITFTQQDSTTLSVSLEGRYYLTSNPSNYTSNTGTVTSVTAGNGMNFTSITGSGSITMGSPSTLTSSTTNTVTSTSHAHNLDVSGFGTNDIISLFSAESVSGTYNWAISTRPNISDGEIGTGIVVINVTSSTNGMSGMFSFKTSTSLSTTLSLKYNGSVTDVLIDSGANLALDLSSEYLLTYTNARGMHKFNLAKYVTQ